MISGNRVRSISRQIKDDYTIFTPSLSMRISNKTLVVHISLITAIYIVLLLLNPELGPRDEVALLPTLQSGKPLPFTFEDSYPYVYFNSAGRFFPLVFQELNVIAFFSNTTFWYFFAICIELIVFMVLFIKFINKFSSHPASKYISLAALMLSPGFVMTFFEIRILERLMIVFLFAFLLSYVAFHKKERPLYFLLALLFANLALYYKETAFILVSTVAFFHLLVDWRRLSIRGRVLDGLLITSSLVFVILYFLIIFPQHGEMLYSYTAYNPLMVMVKNLANYAFFSDPVPTLLLMPLAAWRLYRLFVKKDRLHPVIDPMLFSGAAYAMAYIVLNMYAPYYLLPAFLFALPPILYYYQQGQFNNIFWKTVLGIAGIVFLINTLPFAIHIIAYDKYMPINFNKTIEFLAGDIKSRHHSNRANIFMDGVDLNGGRGTYIILGEFLKYKGLTVKNFDMRSEVENVNQGETMIKSSPFDKDSDIEELADQYGYIYPKYPYTALQPGKGSPITSGDYLIVSPQSGKNFNKKYFEDLKKDYDLVFYTQNSFSVPRFDLKTFVKYFLSQRMSPAQKSHGVMASENMWNWPDYYVFVRK